MGVYALHIFRYSKKKSFGNSIYFRFQVNGMGNSLLVNLERADLNC
jgi:hypothetical protein